MHDIDSWSDRERLACILNTASARNVLYLVKRDVKSHLHKLKHEAWLFYARGCILVHVNLELIYDAYDFLMLKSQGGTGSFGLIECFT
ncbi:unnamed protein product [Clonostachys rosea]|uniref:Uncharacterized protein n=1 Tax=Bionectria ochroleuca TaxID=29856 RepID=A0ABY6UIR5_BIOOC|nr:unnamed protein product [Clonostachys rosea]